MDVLNQTSSHTFQKQNNYEVDKCNIYRQSQAMQEQDNSYSPYKVPASNQNNDSSYNRMIFNDQESSINSTCNDIIEVHRVPKSPLPVPKQLSDMKVQELKNECKMRNLPVSGAKPQLIERLRPYHKEIIDGRASVSYEVFDGTSGSPDEFFVSSSTNNIEFHDSPQNSQNSNDKQPMQSTSAVITNFLQKSNETVKMQIQPNQSQQPSSQVVQLVDVNGKVLGLATVQYPVNGANGGTTGPTTPNPSIMSDVQTTNVISNTSQQTTSYGAVAGPPSQFIQQTDNIYRFSQLGSGGQFTAVNNNEYVNEEPPVYETHRNNQKEQTPAESMQSYKKYMGDDGSSQHLGMVQGFKQQKITLQDSPCAADSAGKSPNMPSSEHMSYNGEITQIDEGHGSPAVMDSQTTQKLLSPKTLQIHEEMLRDQQQQIGEIMNLLSSNQKILKQQQELILAAKKQQSFQQKMRQRKNKQCLDQQQNVMKMSEIRNINKQHIQQFLHHKAQQNQISQIVDEHNRLHKTETRLVEELHVGTAVEDIVRLIKQDARTALLIVSLLHKYRIERDQQHQTGQEFTTPQVSQTPKVEQSLQKRKDSEHKFDGPPPKQKKISNNANTSNSSTNSTTTVINNTNNNANKSPKPKEDVDMEEIFKSVIEDASRSASKPQRQRQPSRTNQRMNDTPVVQKQIEEEQMIYRPNEPMEYSNYGQVVYNGATSSSSSANTPNCTPMQQQPQQQQIHHEPQPHSDHGMNMNQQSHFDNEAFPNIDEMVANMAENDDLKINLDSDELATILGDNWLDNASRNINNNGQYDPQSPRIQNNMYHNDNNLLQTDNNCSISNQQNLDWIDQMIQNDDIMNGAFQ